MMAGRRRHRDMPRHLRAADGRTAFSLIELVVVLLVASVLAAVAVPTFYRSLTHHRLESAARRVKQDLEYLRDSARAQSTTLACKFGDKSDTLDDPSIQHLDHSGAYTIDLAATPYHLDDVTVDSEDDTTIGFDGYGIATADGEVRLQLGGETRTITVESSTDQITISNP